VNGTTATVATALHFPYDPVVNAARVSKLIGVVTGAYVHDLVLDGSGTAGSGIYMSVVANATVANVTVQNFFAEGVLSYSAYNLAWNNITVSRSGNYSGGYGDMVTLVNQGNASINGMSLSSYAGSNAFGLGLHTGANGTFTNVTVDKTASGSGRSCKIHANSYNIFNGLTCENSVFGLYNGLVLNYYSSHNTFNNCVIRNNSGNGIQGFGNYNQYNTFNFCTVSGNTVYQIAPGRSALGQNVDDFWVVNGGTYASVAGMYGIGIGSNNVRVHNVTVSGPGTHGLDVQGSNACVNNNTFSGFTVDIVLNGVNNLGSGNITPDGTIPALIMGICQ
jgi:hypothetical protein